MNLSLGVKVLLVVICALVSIIIGIVAALVIHKPSSPKGPSFLYGGGVFGGSLTLCLVVLTSLGVL
ncbi:hypothetical protein [Streptomyces sp. NBC_00286]|uniref:hypothetical protein n=1 Tax=Streptomyces sp. NBC_00286 TaxID=2975701 RepID=UPI002E2A88AB|nr:hypothetical protein [Streptomyces sp. NBC_00286]